MSVLVIEKDLMDFLKSRGADRDDNGFVVYGPEPPSSFMGAGDELLLPATLQYTVGGRPLPLAADLLQAGFGVGVGVVGEDSGRLLFSTPESPEKVTP